MLDNKFVITLGLLIAVLIGCNSIQGFSSNEGFLGSLPSMKTKVFRSIGNQKGDLYSIPGQYQSMLSPRTNAGIDYGANIRYNVPSYKNLAVPSDPLALGDMVSENYRPGTKENYDCKKGGGSKSFKEHGVDVQSGFAAGNFNEVAEQVYDNSQYPDTVSMLPVGNMTTVNSAGEVVQPVIYDRFIYANRNSRLRSQGDPIRGDLAIVPCASDWFRPSVHPQFDLMEGAMNVMGGIGNETTQSLAELIAIASAGTTDTISGVDMSNHFATTLGAGYGDVSTVAFS
jgi:hypothetical protein